MADIWDDDYEEQQNQQTESDLVKQLRAKIREDKKKLEEQSKELGELRPKLRSQSVASILTDMKLNPKIAALIPSTVEADEASVKGWVEEFGDLFNISAPQGSEENQAQPPAQPGIDPSVAAQWARVQGQESQSGVTTPDKEAQDLAMLQAAYDAAGGNSDLYFAYLKGEIPLPASGQTAAA